jgi:hypothetical protein
MVSREVLDSAKHMFYAVHSTTRPTSPRQANHHGVRSLVFDLNTCIFYLSCIQIQRSLCHISNCEYLLWMACCRFVLKQHWRKCKCQELPSIWSWCELRIPPQFRMTVPQCTNQTVLVHESRSPWSPGRYNIDQSLRAGHKGHEECRLQVVFSLGQDDPGASRGYAGWLVTRNVFYLNKPCRTKSFEFWSLWSTIFFYRTSVSDLTEPWLAPTTMTVNLLHVWRLWKTQTSFQVHTHITPTVHIETKSACSLTFLHNNHILDHHA